MDEAQRDVVKLTLERATAAHLAARHKLASAMAGEPHGATTKVFELLLQDWLDADFHERCLLRWAQTQ